MSRNIVVILLRAIFYLPHILLFLCSSNRSLVIKDVVVYKNHRGLNLSIIYVLLFLLENDKYFRNLFYYRLGKPSYLVKWYSPGAKSFYLYGKIGGGVYIPHPFATIINAKEIGDNFTCRQCTTIGNKEDGRNDLRPTIGNNVTLGANVCIIGDVHIGNNVIIGCGSVVVKDVPDNCVVVGNPARVIKTI